jgi:Flp pilus assembly protein TadG
MMNRPESVSITSARPKHLRGLRALLRRLRAEEGSAMVEMGCVIALFAPLLLVGTAEVAQIAYDVAEVQEAANEGAASGMVSPTLAASNSAITAAAQADAPDFGANLTVTPTTYWVCATTVSGTQYSSQSSANSACTGSGNGVLEFLQVKTSATVTLPIHFAKLGASYTMTGVSVQEVEQ